MRLHLHARKRLHSKAGLEPYPARRFSLYVLDTIVYAVGILGPIMVIPQVYLIYSTKQAAGIEPVAWAAWALMDIPWIVYGFAHKEMPIVLTYSLWLVGNVLVCAGGILY